VVPVGGPRGEAQSASSPRLRRNAAGRQRAAGWCRVSLEWERAPRVARKGAGRRPSDREDLRWCGPSGLRRRPARRTTDARSARGSVSDVHRGARLTRASLRGARREVHLEGGACDASEAGLIRRPRILVEVAAQTVGNELVREPLDRELEVTVEEPSRLRLQLRQQRRRVVRADGQRFDGRRGRLLVRRELGSLSRCMRHSLQRSRSQATGHVATGSDDEDTHRGASQATPRRLSRTICRSWVMPMRKPASLMER
jgi:hypothetical protein